MAIIMEAKTVFEAIKDEVRREAEALKQRGVTPGLAAILVGEDPTSQMYVSMKQADCGKVGIRSLVYEVYKHPKEVKEKELMSLIEQLNRDEEIHGILVQLPFPDFVNEERVFEALSPGKDVDGLTPHNMGKLMRGEYDPEGSLLPCTPKGVVKLLDHYDVEVKGKDVVIVGRSKLVGEPLRKLLQDKGATVSNLHRRTKNVDEKLLQADIVVCAAGRPPELYQENSFRLTGDMVKGGVVVVGVGVRKDLVQNKLLFDVDFDDVKEKASYITPNTGGVGLMTRAMLLKNAIIATKRLVQ